MSGSSLNQEELDAKIAHAISCGYEVVRADSRHLLLDLDSQAALDQYEAGMSIMAEHFGAVEEQRWTSKSGNTHIVVRIEYEQPWMTRYAMQSALGSDGRRDLLAIRQMLNGCDEASLLFKPVAKLRAVALGG